MSSPIIVEQTEFNSNVATLERIDQLLRMATNSHYEEDLGGYFKHLRSLQLEIIVKMNDSSAGSKKDKKTAEKELVSEKVESKKLFKTLQTKFFLFGKGSFSIPDVLEFERLLYEFEEFLRNIANKRGMLLSDKKDSSWDALK